MTQTIWSAVTEAIAYIEAHLDEKLDLETVAAAVHYSKYHLHHMFTAAVGMTLHDYVRRRQLTEAAKLLVFSRKSIMEAALAAGFESQQAFTGIFKDMYKQTPGKYRENQKFYPLQLRISLNHCPSSPEDVVGSIAYARLEDISAWLDFMSDVVQDFPCFQEAEYLQSLQRYMEDGRALVMWDRDLVVGAMACSGDWGNIDFLGVRPQYRGYGIEEAFLRHAACRILPGGEIGITTFRKGDKADTGQRRVYKRLGFVESELLTEFGYPTQRLVWKAVRMSDQEDNFCGFCHRRKSGGGGF